MNTRYEIITAVSYYCIPQYLYNKYYLLIRQPKQNNDEFAVFIVIIIMEFKRNCLGVDSPIKKITN